MLVQQPLPNRKDVLTKSLLNCAKTLSISQSDLGLIIGKERQTIAKGINPDSKAGEIALLFIRVYRSLFVLVGGNPDDMKHWLNTQNYSLNGIPIQLMKTVTGLVNVLTYLDAMRGKV